MRRCQVVDMDPRSVRVTSTECVLFVSDCKRRIDSKAKNNWVWFQAGCHDEKFTKVGLPRSRSARSPPTVTELDLVHNGTYAELLPLQSTAYLEVANSS